jgi:hypothetical protein
LIGCYYARGPPGFHKLRNFSDAIVLQGSFLILSMSLVALIESIAKGVVCDLCSAHMPKCFRTATEFQERGKCFELFPGEFLDDAERRRIFWFVG